MNKEEKYKKTCLERYGVPCNLLINVKERNKKIWKEQHDKIILKRNITLNERYNCGDNFLKSEYFKEKSKNTLIKNYGSIENAYNVKTIKSKETKKKKYGSENYNNSNKTKITLENIQLIHIYEFNWINNKEEIKNNIINLLNKNDCSYCNWISLNDFHNYLLSEPNEYKFRNYIIYDEGTFIKKINY